MTETNANEWFESAPVDQKSILAKLRTLVLETGTDIEESIKWSRPCYCTTNGLFCYIHRTKHHVTLGFQHGASLDDPGGVLEGEGADMRHIKIGSPNIVDIYVIKALLEQAYSASAS